MTPSDDEKPLYTVPLANRAAVQVPALDAAIWEQAAAAAISHFHAKSSSHRPVATARLLYDQAGFFGRFDVQDQFVLARYTQNQSQVCQDSCVEFFFRPTADSGYFNFEFNAIGTKLAYYMTRPDHLTSPANTALTPEEMAAIQVQTTLRGPLDPEIATPQKWQLAFAVPWDVLRHYLPHFTIPPTHATGNFYKCADHSSHPHWGSWADIGARLAFHQPERFGGLLFGKAVGSL